MTFLEGTPEQQTANTAPARRLPIAGAAKVPDEDRYESLAVQLHEATDLQRTVECFLTFAVDFLACDHATIALKHGTEIRPAAATDEASRTALAAQLSIAQGPCVTAISTGLSVLVPDTANDTRWPEWTRQVAQPGRSIFSIPLIVSSRTLGALTLIGEHPHIFDADDIRATRIVTYGAVGIASAQQHDSLLLAAQTGKRIGQAIGMLRERFSVDEARAFEILRRYSQDSNTKLRDVAEHILATGQLPG